jgi:hypothetical protein
LWNNGDLILRARKPGHSQSLQLIPRTALLGDFPRQFVDQYVHWLDLGTRELEFRLAGSPWTPEPSNWRLYIHEPGIYPRATFRKPGQDGSIIQLIDVRSNTFTMLSSLLSPLESPELITVTHTSQFLEVFAPRLHLSFFVNSNWELECRSIPGYVVDKTQSCGTMFGLGNKLILCPRPNSSKVSLLPRRVIIPQGKVSFSTMGDFTGVSINTGAEQHVRWHEYTIDTDLGRLTSKPSLKSKLYQCYLHALTSHCLPDPLLGHTGTEEALYMLQSAACRSFQRLDRHDAKLLKLISDLTPDRVYYPRHLQSMAIVTWNDIPTLSQHHDFYRVVYSILGHARALETLYDPPTVFDTPDRNQSLLDRAASRNKSYYPSDLQISEQPPSLGDIEYRSRDVSNREDIEHVAYRTSWSIWKAQPSLDHGLPRLWDLMCSWGSLGPANSEVSLCYSRYWLEFDATRDWIVIYDLCRHAVYEGLLRMRIKLSFCLSAAAYSKSKYSNIIPFFVAFALDERCRHLNPPTNISYTLSDGITPVLTRLENLVSGSALPIASIPAHFLMAEATSAMDVETQRMTKYESTIRRESSLVANSIILQWQNYSYRTLRSVGFREQWFDQSKCHQRIEEYFQSISRNIELRDHVNQLQSILQHYRNGPVPITLPYVFSPRFITSHSKALAPPYSICEVLLSRTNVPTLFSEEPFLGDGISPTTETAGTLEPVGPDSLKVLIDEFRNSRKSLLELYGNDLKKSHCKWVEHSASQSTRSSVPAHNLELLCLYHEECSHRKDKMFSEVSATLAPSQDVEKTSGIAGLWPRITPRSLLRLLAQDRIGTLPDQWKATITRYAICLLKYQQSRRLLELSSSQKREELFQETKTMCSDILSESTPDWLLVQVRPHVVGETSIVD